MKRAALLRCSSAVKYVVCGKAIELSNHHEELLRKEFSRDGLLARKAVLGERLSSVRERSGKIQASLDIAERKARRFPDAIGAATMLYLSTQFVVLFNWVFFKFDWGLVEPVTYFLGYTGVWLGVLHHCVRGGEFTYDAVREALFQYRRKQLIKSMSIDEVALLSLREEERTLVQEIAQAP